ncbi:MAG: riboflavin kinase [Candidatus Magasanikbacteria bacterium]|nr:riboflavin kinase [Candidatus Magasanikbacteria bacterium]
MFIVDGTVVVGLQRGRTIGYPTVNISYADAIGAEPGVYAARVRIGEKDFFGAAVVGGDFISSKKPKLEINLFDDSTQNRYGELVHVELVEKISELEKIADRLALIEKIERDVAAVKKYFELT